MGGGGGIRGGGLEVKLSTGAVEDDSSSVIGTGRVFSGGESAEPLARAFTWLADLGDPFAPAALADTAVTELVVVWAALAFSFTGAIGGSGRGRRGSVGGGGRRKRRRRRRGRVWGR